MHVISVQIKLKPQYKEAFLKDLRRHMDCIQKEEPGCLQFDVSNDKADSDTILLYEVYADDAALARHRTSPSLRLYMETTKDWAVSRTVINAVRQTSVRAA